MKLDNNNILIVIIIINKSNNLYNNYNISNKKYQKLNIKLKILILFINKN